MQGLLFCDNLVLTKGEEHCIRLIWSPHVDPILTIDIGAGTTDILVYLPDSGEHYKAVAVSPIKRLSQMIIKMKGDLLITGELMGGGAVSNALVSHARSYKVFITPEAARTVSDSTEKIRAQGITIISAKEARQLRREMKLNHLVFGDISPSGLATLLEELGQDLSFSFVAGAVQDHGVSPHAMGALDFRHSFFREIIERNPWPDAFLFPYDEISRYLTRMRATGKLLGKLKHQKLFMMDTGAAAIVGASLDSNSRDIPHIITIDIGNSHTLGAVLSEGKIGGFFEYHTNRITSQKLEQLLVKLGNGNLAHSDVVSEGGHGAYIRACPGFDHIEQIVVTGPRRREIMESANITYIEGVPLGDNMMTGTVGLLECINRREKLGLFLP
jgi:uncharacterized protein (DUF1786 family)